jgi:hypothetical protein
MALQETAAGALMRIRRLDTCTDCNADLPAGTLAYWVRSEQLVRCLPCFDARALAARSGIDGWVPAFDRGVAGGSAQREYERRWERERTRHEETVSVDAAWRERMRREHPLLGSTIAVLKPKP